MLAGFFNVVYRSAEYGLKLPSILAFKRNDPFQTVDVFDNKFTSQAIVDFVLKSNVPSFVSMAVKGLILFSSCKF